MKKVLLIMALAAVLLVASTAPAQAQWGPWKCGEYACERVWLGEPSHYGVTTGWWGLHPSENVRIWSREEWDRDRGEREFRQEPDLDAKKIDAMTTLGTMLILGITLGVIAR